jgi:protein Mpv17
VTFFFPNIVTMRLIIALFSLYSSVCLGNFARVSAFTSPFQQKHKQSLSSRSKVKAVPFSDVFVSLETIESSKNLLHLYKNWLTQYPVETKAITSGILATAGDAIAQISSSNDEDYDYARGLCFLMFGALYTGVFQHFWFDFLSDHISQWGEMLQVWGPSRASIPVEDVYSLQEWWNYFDVVSTLENPPSQTTIATAKLAVNQFLIVPSLYMPLFFAVTGSLAKLDFDGSMERARSMYIPLIKRNYFFWLPMQFVQFLFIPADWQILYISLASLLWTVILSSIATEQPKAPSPGATVQSVVIDATGTDAVSLEDVEKALIPRVALDVLEDPKFSRTTLGGVFGLLASAANDGLLGGFVSNLLGATIGSGVAVMAATGALIGLVTASDNEDQKEFPEEQMARQQVEISNASPPASDSISSAEALQ